MSATAIVVADIGGTHARFAIAQFAADGAIALGPETTLRTADHARFEDAWRAYAAQRGGNLPRDAALAVAGPVGGEEIRFTNNPWTIRPATLAGALGLDRHVLLNDFAAVAHTVARTPDDQLLHVAGPPGALPHGTISVIGPGTGLGVAYLWRDAARYQVFPTEGAHFAFGPADEIEDAVLARLRRRLERVSAERVVAGPGLAEIHATLAERAGRTPEPASDAELWSLALSGSDPLADEALDRFCLALGSVAGDLALTQGAAATVIAGGLAQRIGPARLGGGFAERYVAKGRYRTMMQGFPIRLLTHSQPGLFGAAAAFGQTFLPG